MTDSFLRFGPIFILLLLAATSDYRTGLIPNRLILLGMCIVLPAQLLAQGYLARQGLNGFLQIFGTSATGLVVCALAPLILFYSKGIGGGDVKLLAMLGAFLGPSIGLEIELYAFGLIALYAMAMLSYRGRLLAMLGNTMGLARNVFVAKRNRHMIPAELLTSLRFAPAILVAMILIASLELTLR